MDPGCLSHKVPKVHGLRVKVLFDFKIYRRRSYFPGCAGRNQWSLSVKNVRGTTAENLHGRKDYLDPSHAPETELNKSLEISSCTRETYEALIYFGNAHYAFLRTFLFQLNQISMKFKN